MFNPSTIDWHSPIGGNLIYWIKNEKLVGQFVTTNNLKSQSHGTIAAETMQTVRILRDLGIRGGIRVPHLHYQNEIYLLDHAQWTKFSADIVSDLKAKLSKVNEIGFDEALILSNTVSTLIK